MHYTEVMTVYNLYNRSHYYVKLSERYHYFDRKYRSLSDSEENAEETLYS